jgi:undecaprenyl-diphosphatase
VLRVLRNPDDPADPIGPAWVEEMARDATAGGGVGWLAFTVVVVAIYLRLTRKPHLMIFTLAATVGGTVVSMALKSLFARPRPDLVPHLSHVSTSSFPSGHSMLSAIVYLTLGSLLAAIMPTRGLKFYILSIAVLLTICVGLSRIYLGVHYPTDVLAGWLAGLVWALACWLVARWLQGRHQVEQEPAAQ